MTEPENFEDDLFADLYADDEPAKTASAPKSEPAAPAPSAQTAAPAPAPPPVAASAPAPAPDSNDYHHQGADHAAGQDAGDDYHMNGAEEDDEDDDVDFNLGNGNDSTHHADTPTYGSGTPVPTTSIHARGPNSKEDG